MSQSLVTREGIQLLLLEIRRGLPRWRSTTEPFHIEDESEEDLGIHRLRIVGYGEIDVQPSARHEHLIVTATREGDRKHSGQIFVTGRDDLSFTSAQVNRHLFPGSRASWDAHCVSPKTRALLTKHADLLLTCDEEEFINTLSVVWVEFRPRKDRQPKRTTRWAIDPALTFDEIMAAFRKTRWDATPERFLNRVLSRLVTPGFAVIPGPDEDDVSVHCGKHEIRLRMMGNATLYTWSSREDFKPRKLSAWGNPEDLVSLLAAHLQDGAPLA